MMSTGFFSDYTWEHPGRSAILSPCKTYRYILERTWDENKDSIVFIMLNPSTADALKDDPTVRKCMKYARAWGYGGLVVLNLIKGGKAMTIYTFTEEQLWAFVERWFGGSENDEARNYRRAELQNLAKKGEVNITEVEDPSLVKTELTLLVRGKPKQQLSLTYDKDYGLEHRSGWTATVNGRVKEPQFTDIDTAMKLLAEAWKETKEEG